MTTDTLARTGAVRLARFARHASADELAGPPRPDGPGLSARQIADQLGHPEVSVIQNRYLGGR